MKLRYLTAALTIFLSGCHACEGGARYGCGFAATLIVAPVALPLMMVAGGVRQIGALPPTEYPTLSTASGAVQPLQSVALPFHASRIEVQDDGTLLAFTEAGGGKGVSCSPGQSCAPMGWTQQQCSVSPDGHFCLRLDGDRAHLIDARTGALAVPLPGLQGFSLLSTISDRGEVFYPEDRAGYLKATTEGVKTFPFSGGSVVSVARVGRENLLLLLSKRQDSTWYAHDVAVHLLDDRSNREIGSLSIPDSVTQVGSLKVAPQGRWYAVLWGRRSASAATLFQVSQGGLTLFGTVYGAPDGFFEIAFSPSARRVAILGRGLSSTDNNRVSIYSL